MTKEAARVLQEAMHLSAAERALIAEELLSGLDDSREEVEAAWAAEITRRADDARSNPADDLDWREALRDVEQEVLGRSR
jgi:putative addiction module component (TIGR02574 family)